MHKAECVTLKRLCLISNSVKASSAKGGVQPECSLKII